MIHVLDAVTDREVWLERWAACGREPFAHPSYSGLFAAAGERALALVVENGGEFALLPLIVRPVPAALSQDELTDAISPYGYGGPFVSGSVDIDQVLTEVEDWAANEGICSAFLRLSLESGLSGRLGTGRTAITETADNIVVNLRQSPEELWANYEHKVRKNVKKALRAGCSVRRDDNLQDVDAFLNVYSSTMQRRSAAQWYRFDRSFFSALADGISGSYSVFSVVNSQDEVVSVELVLQSDAYLYSFLGGTLAEAFSMSPNDLLKHEVASFGQQTGRHGYVLGGGYKKDDGIYRYKKAFDPQGVRGFRTAKLIGCQQRYDALVAARLQEVGGVLDEGFFPAYRASVAAL
ncbi:GNAT family N-acetyltransferase [Actinoplanes sp. NPDC051859]|uniref:GNAT family N-acetyltransferase n=1 Tax=Actinoplanes sp. NPDC051859 TaxID=3363909 RepID=UPI00379FCBD9